MLTTTMTRISQSGMRTETVDKESLTEDTRRVWRVSWLTLLLSTTFLLLLLAVVLRRNAFLKAFKFAFGMSE